jgi:phospholipase/lecithinase/hemolysin
MGQSCCINVQNARLGVPDIGLTPQAIALGPTAQAEASGLAQAFNGALFGSLGAVGVADGVHITTLDTYALLDSIVANPGAYGFTNVTQPCDATSVNYSGGASCATPNQYLFWDTIHPTASAQAIVAADAASALAPEPGTVSLFAAGFLVMGIAFLHRRRA